MRVLVQKFGGTSVKDKTMREHAVHHIEDALREGFKVVVVVSAMGRFPDPYSTDSLLSLIDGNDTALSNKEKDLLMSCGETISATVFSHELLKRNINAVGITGGEAGIITTDTFTNAQIKTVESNHLFQLLTDHQVVVVAGFQGRTEKYEVTTIGRGGSDTSATALGAALDAEYVDIFTDVNGIMTADPRVVTNAKRLDAISYTEICNLAYQGAKVIHPRAVEIAMQANVPIRVRSTMLRDKGTLITNLSDSEYPGSVQDRLVTGIAYVNHITQIKIKELKEPQQIHVKVFKAMAEAGISVDFINISPNGVIYTIFERDEILAKKVLESLGLQPEFNKDCAKVSLVGAGMSGVPGVTSKIVQTLTNKDIPILQSADSHRTIWVLIQSKHLESALNALHVAFDLEN
ncbi:aspartate kinase [Gracilibacillus caseinilyticus]|uniref:Aspartokinase n=1 Tax=Gracilibacillus caseinilyticus TaxID=2932256 RepID=A0ABY4EUS8_9BACI|nr:aspartate kinase [Gracilibacillus caseinilyticus]UOQ47821.1 aspartate kinase [Gracilibacillus caseinilyticus]